MLIIDNNDEALAYIDRQPSTSTLAYYKLDSTTKLTDKMGNYNLTNTGGVTFGTNQGVDCAYFNGASNSQLYNSSMSFSARPTQTVLIWFYVSSNNSNVYQTIYHIGTTNSTGKLGTWFKYNLGLCIGSRAGGYESIKSGNVNGSRHCLANVTNGSSCVQYLDGVEYQTYNNSLTNAQTALYV